MKQRLDIYFELFNFFELESNSDFYDILYKIKDAVFRFNICKKKVQNKQTSKPPSKCKK